ncbi:MAG: effector-associated domain EAD1-containing protein [Saprospiraceae bacterium]|nr:effector-associated domain EAD1-containing protein [Saprospiraceae bacterium]
MPDQPLIEKMIDINHWAKPIREALAEGFEDRRTFKQFLLDELGKNFDDFTSETGYQTQLSETITTAYQAGWLEKLIREAVRIRPHFDALQNLLALFAERRGANDPRTPYQRVLLRGNRPFINRTDLRTALQNMLHDNGSRVLLLQGDPQTGVTWAYWYIQHLADSYGIKSININVMKNVFVEGEVGGLQLASYLDSRFDIKYGVTDVKAWENYRHTTFINTMTKFVDQLQQKLIIFYDDLKQPPLGVSGIDFIRKLIEEIETNWSGKVYLVLVRLPEGIPPDYDGHVTEYLAKSFLPQDIHDFFENFYYEYALSVEGPLHETKEEFVTKSVQMFNERIDVEAEPNVKIIGDFMTDYCAYISENGIQL